MQGESNLKSGKRRDRESQKCECPMIIPLKHVHLPNRGGPTNGHFLYLPEFGVKWDHNATCDPSPQQVLLGNHKSTHKKISNDVLTGLKCLVQANCTAKQWRSFMVNHQLNLDMSVKGINNLKMLCVREIKAGRLKDDVTLDLLKEAVAKNELTELFAVTLVESLRNEDASKIKTTLDLL